MNAGCGAIAPSPHPRDGLHGRGHHGDVLMAQLCKAVHPIALRDDAKVEATGDRW